MRTDWSESAYGMLTAKVEMAKETQLMSLNFHLKSVSYK